jgi:hypothetical protein
MRFRYPLGGMAYGNATQPGIGLGRAYSAFTVLMLVNLALTVWQPGTMAHAAVNGAFVASVPLLIGVRIRNGYLRRRQHWTRESWLRYLSLAWLPVAAIVVFFALVLMFDYGPGVFGSPGSPARRTFIAVELALMFFGASGLLKAVNWLTDGEPSQQFTRTAWFQRQRPS